ncbi:Ankyrin [Coniochaeta hoffmannii]|uniref:Ankyrin n=1 Tax=Coniochaeta hoffmannii TaxID=91930 RepID=A0AA38S9M7_9PEZI|nr:Ankyrin [Coniochaeta hoffmannii]
MAPTVSEEEVDDLLYLARAGEKDELAEFLSSLSTRENVSTAEILTAAKDEGKNTCLHMAAGNGHLEIVNLLVSQFSSGPEADRQAYLDAANEFGNTGLHWAALGGHLDVVKLLMESGASPVLANDKEYVPLDLAAQNGKFDVVDYFFAQSKGKEGENGDGLAEAAGGVSIDGAESGAGEGKGEEEGVADGAKEGVKEV